MPKKKEKFVCLDCIQQLEKYLKYATTKYKPRSNGYQSAVEDCIEVLQGNFSKIKERDYQFEIEHKQKLQNARKKIK